MEKEQLIEKMLNDKAEKNNTIDLNAYAAGLNDMYDALKSDNFVNKEPDRFRFGANENYEIGDVVVWRGEDPCIGRINGKCRSFHNSFMICEDHNSLHISNLRYAEPDEIKKLGENQILLITPEEADR